MSRDARISLEIWDGDYEFRLGWGELVQLQEATDAGPYVILERMRSGAWRMQDIEATLRLGLIGAGTKPEDATRAIKLHVKTRPAMEYLLQATFVLQAGLLGAGDEPAGEGGAPDLEAP